MSKKLAIAEEKAFLDKFLMELVNDNLLNTKVCLIKKDIAISKFNNYCKRNNVTCGESLGKLLERNQFFFSTKIFDKTPFDYAICLKQFPNIFNENREKVVIKDFLIQMYNKRLLDSTGLTLRREAIAEFDIYCERKNIEFDRSLGNILESNGFLRTYCGRYLKNPNKTIWHYEINLDKLNVNELEKHNSVELKKLEGASSLSNAVVTKTLPYSNGISKEILSNENSKNSSDMIKPKAPEEHEYDISSEKTLSYCKNFTQTINIDYSPTIMSCKICQENFQTKIAFDMHLKDNHLADLNKNDYMNNRKYSDSLQDSKLDPYFKISFIASGTTYFLKFKIIYCKENITVLNIYTIKSLEFIEVKYTDKEQYFYVNQNLFTVGIIQPVYIIFKDANDHKIEEHHFLVFDQFPDVIGIQLKSLKVLRRAELPRKKLLQNMPNPNIVSCAKNGFCDYDLKTISPELRRYIEDDERKLHDNNFISVLTNLLAIEDQYTMNLYSIFNQKDVLITGSGSEYSIPVNYSKNMRLENVVKQFDEIIIKIKTKKKLKILHGMIWNVTKNSITFQCMRGNLSKKIADIEFLPSRITVRYQYCALSNISSELRHILFPIINFFKYAISNISLDIYNESIKDNPEQLEAVRNIVLPSNKEIPYIIFGPPGTGKTTTLVESIMQLLKQNKDYKILVSSSSNAACNEVAKRLTKLLNYTNPNDMILLRIFSGAGERQSEILSETDPLLFQASNHVYNEHFYPSMDSIVEYKVIVSTLAVVGRYVLGGLKPGFFSHVFIDEAAASTEPEALVGISKVLSKTSHLILSGDTKQLGPVLLSTKAKELGLGKSLMERLLERDCYKVDENGKYDNSIQTRLRRNFRSHKKIIHLSNHLFYDNELIPEAREELTDWALGWHKLPNKDFPIIFHNVQGSCVVDAGETSSYNLEEKNIVVKYVKEMIRDGINGRKIVESDIGIISPYKKQYTLIKDSLNSLNFKSIEAGSVEIFQGKEKPIIIASLVKSFKSVGFLNEYKRINVMLSRPQALLIIIGNSITLSQIPAFDYVIKYCKDNHSFINTYNNNNNNNQIMQINRKLHQLNIHKN